MGRNLRILSINGGGIRGLTPIKIIEKLVKISGVKFEELFDYVIGTSAGGIIAVSLTVKDENNNAKFTPTDIVNIFKNEADKIFPPSIFDSIPVINKLISICGAKYSRKSLDKLLNEKLGNATFLNTTIPITTISYSLDSDGPRLWSTYRAQIEPKYHNYYLKDAAGATSAAPTYFPAKITKIANGEVFHDIDGGIFANSPTIIGVREFAEANKYQNAEDRLTVVSIGTGRFKNNPEFVSESALSDVPLKGVFTGTALAVGMLWKLPTPGKLLAIPLIVGGLLYDAYSNEGAIGWITRKGLIDRMMKGAEITDAFQSKLFNVFRINPPLDSQFEPMDKTDKKHLKEFDQAITEFIENHQTSFKILVECLKTGKEEICETAKIHSEPFQENFFHRILGTGDLFHFDHKE